jgi:hypothetical protein
MTGRNTALMALASEMPAAVISAGFSGSTSSERPPGRKTRATPAPVTQRRSHDVPITPDSTAGACRHPVADRLDITAARWTLAGAEAVLKLRALISSADFETCRACHLGQEHRRTHRSRYRLAA